MRQALHNVGTPDHVALAYDAWGPVGDDGKVPDSRRAQWLSDLAGVAVASDYARSFDRWKASFAAPGDRLAELTLASRLLIGHGNASASDVGLTVHHTWSVPMIPGSALKGLVAHYVDATYGPTDDTKRPGEQQGEGRIRANYQGVTWNRRRIERGPGAVYRALFGAPEAREDATMRENGFEAGAVAGLVTFHDALYVPGSSGDDKPFSPDVLTVHQKGYYDSCGKSAPNDYDSPNPVAFLTVRPRARFLVALSGPDERTELAERLICDALESWGIGGKTSSGYGRLAAPGTLATTTHVVAASAARIVPKPGDRVEATLLEERTKRGGWRARHETSGLMGPVHNTSEVPADNQAGDALSLIVASANEREIAYRYPTAEEEARAHRKPKRGRQAGRRPK